jgi:hypothetical protein
LINLADTTKNNEQGDIQEREKFVCILRRVYYHITAAFNSAKLGLTRCWDPYNRLYMMKAMQLRNFLIFVVTILIFDTCNSSNTPFSRRTSYEAQYDKVSGFESWKGYIGQWYLGINATLDDIPPTMRAMRLWKKRELGNKDMITQRNIYERLVPPLNGAPREWDSNLETFYDRSIENSAYEPNIFGIDGSVQGSIPGSAQLRTVVLSTDAVVGLTAQISAQPQLLTVDESASKTTERINRPSGIWGHEIFITDERNKWSTVCGWSTATGERTYMSLIQEYFVDLSDSELDCEIQMEDTPLLPARKSLSRDILEWFGDNTIMSGTRIGMEVEAENGNFLRVPETFLESCPWPPADMIENVSDDNMDLIPLPDSMYLLIPRKLCTYIDGNSKSEMHMEFGGIMRNGEGMLMKRTILTYDTMTSFLKSVKHDVFNVSTA